MANANFTEKLLRLATSKQNAAAITGDLVQADASALEQIQVVARMYAAAKWRYAVGGILGLPLAYGSLRLSAVILEHHLTSANFSGNSRWIFWSFVLTLCSITFSFIGTLSLMRFGRNSTQAWAAFSLAVVAILSASLTWLPHSGLLIGSLLALLTVTALALPKLRKPVVIATGAGVLFAATFIGTLAGLAASNVHTLPSPMVLYAVLVTAWAAAVLTGSVTLSVLHARFALSATD